MNRVKCDCGGKVFKLYADGRGKIISVNCHKCEKNIMHQKRKDGDVEAPNGEIKTGPH